MSSKDSIQLADISDQDHRYSITELCEICQMDDQWILEMIEFDVIVSENTFDEFNHTQLQRLMKAVRLQRDLEINTAGVALALELLETIDDLKIELKLLRRQTRLL